MSDSDIELEKANQELLDKRKENKSINNGLDIEGIMKRVEALKNVSTERVRPTCEFCGTYTEPNYNNNGKYECFCEKYIKDKKQKKIEHDLAIINKKLPRKYQSKDFNNYIGNEETIKKIKSGIEDYKSIIISGSIGTGKTHIAIAYAREIMLDALNDRDIEGSFLITTIIEMQSALMDKEFTINHYKKVDLLVIDDLGAEKVNEWRTDKIFEIINYRMMETMPTIITTNLSSKELEENIGSRTYSRIIEMCDKYKIVGSDYRLK